VNLAVYLLDSDDNGIEPMIDRPRAEGPRGPEGGVARGWTPSTLTGWSPKPWDQKRVRRTIVGPRMCK
jgi:catechol-2,3-dioxygenase